MSDISITTDAIDQGSPFAAVTLAGELDFDTAAQVRSALIGLERRGNLQFVIDLTGVVILDSTGLAVLVGAHKRATAAGGGLALVATTEAIRKVLRITGTSKTIGVCTSAEEAYATLQQAAAATLRPVDAPSDSGEWIPTGTDADLAALLDGFYWCGRVWAAWEIGTMTVDDFSPASESELPADLIAWRDAAVRAAITAERERIRPGDRVQTPVGAGFVYALGAAEDQPAAYVTVDGRNDSFAVGDLRLLTGNED